MSLCSSQEIADQMRRRKFVRKGFRLCIMVCGRAGVGKSTFINTLCDGEVWKAESTIEPTQKIEVQSHQADLCEADGTIINLSVVDTPGFGEKIDNSDNASTIARYLEAQFDAVLYEEALICRNPRFVDSRVHACLYFLPPTGRGLRELDAEVMTALSSRVSIIPVIGKADTMTDEELLMAKQVVMDDIRTRNIPIFSFNYDTEDPESMEEDEALREMLPFAVVGSNSIYKIGTEYIRARQYPWGLVKVEDPQHSDFVTLRSVLFGSHIQELKDITQDVIYEKYRTEQLYRDPQLFARIRQQETNNAHRSDKVR